MREITESEQLDHAYFVQSSFKRQRLQGKKGDIMHVARILFETQGLATTSIKSITEEAGITRELFYYYFKDKQDIIDAVIDDFVEDLVESALVWNEFREFGDTKGSLRKCIEAFRRALEDTSGARPLFNVLDELGRRDEFRLRAVKETVDALDKYVVTEYAIHHKIEIEYVRESFAALLFGFIGLVRMNPAIEDEVLMKITEQVLHLDMTPVEK